MKKNIKNLLSIVVFYKAKAPIIMLRQFLFQMMQRFSNKEGVEKKIYNYKMLLPLKDDGLGRVLYVLGERELDHKWLIDKEVREDDRILDLGANIGYYAIMEAMKLSDKGRIFAVEPDPRNTLFFEKNIQLNNLQNKVEFTQGAISNHNGKAVFGLHKRTNLNSFNFSSDSADSEVEEVDVDVIDFGDFVQKLGGVDLVRMDVEGHEFEIFQSLVKLMATEKKLAPRTIIFETHCYKSAELMKEIMMQLFDGGYRVKYMTSDDELGPQKSIISQKGYKPLFIIDEWGASRGIYEEINNADASELISNWKGTRTICLELTV
jgi:FkbM family methyltransferase